MAGPALVRKRGCCAIIHTLEMLARCIFVY